MDRFKKSSWNGVDDDDDDDDVDDQKQWPNWLPHDWCIHRNFTNFPEIQLYYSNPRGEKFYSKEEVVQYIAIQSKKRSTKQTKRKAPKRKGKVEGKKLKAEIELQFLGNPREEWPDWLPQDWFIERSRENPTNVYYCSPKWKKFRTKDEVLHHLHKNSKLCKKLRKKRKISQSEDSTKKHPTIILQGPT